MAGPNAKANFSAIRAEHKETIDALAPGHVEWRELPDNKESQIRVIRESTPSDKNSWPGLNAWMAETLEAWSAALRPIIKSISPSPTDDGTADDETSTPSASATVE